MVLEFSLGTFRPEKQDYLFRFSVAPVNFLLEQVKKSCAIEGDVIRDDSERRFLAQHSASMLKQCCNHSRHGRNDVATLCCAKTRRRQSYQRFLHVKGRNLAIQPQAQIKT